MKIERPPQNEYAAPFERYVSRVPEDDALPALARQPSELRTALSTVSEDREGFRYGPDKWSIREVLGHLIDAERVFGYRALCIARGDLKSLPGFEENDYAAKAGHDRVGLADLLAEFAALRQSQVSMLSHLDGASVSRARNRRPVRPDHRCCVQGLLALTLRGSAP